jgi:RNA polymerase sigma factor (sigma-70 family)
MTSETEPDDELVRRLRAATTDRARNDALADIVDRYAEKLIVFILLKFGGRLFKEDAQEIVQDALLAAAESIQTFDRKKGTFSTWLRGITYRRAVQKVRKDGAEKRGGKVTVVSMSGSEDGFGPPEVEDHRGAGRQAAVDALLDELEKLPSVQRDIIRSLMYASEPGWGDDRSVDEELSGRHNMSVSEIRMERSKVLSHLREALVKQGRWKGNA